MEKIKTFIRTSLLGGLVVILPVTILVMAARWFFNLVTNQIQPLSNVFLKGPRLPEFFADIVAIIVMLLVFFLVGVFVRTRFGNWIYNTVEERVLKVAPGYTLIKETVLQFVGSKKPPFSSVALVRPFQNDTMATAFITEHHADGSYTVFVPTGPNPTSGNIFHLGKDYVHPVTVPVEAAMRSVIGCGAGSARLIQEYKKQTGKREPPAVP